MTKLVIDPKTSRILGVGIVGPGAGELISEGVLAIEMGANAEDLKMTVHPHPTLSETLMESGKSSSGRARTSSSRSGSKGPRSKPSAGPSVLIATPHPSRASRVP